MTYSRKDKEMKEFRISIPASVCITVRANNHEEALDAAMEFADSTLELCVENSFEANCYPETDRQQFSIERECTLEDEGANEPVPDLIRKVIEH
jgi:hypothetical protein